MNFIEGILHMSPDGGTGLWEATIFLAVLAIPIFRVVLRTFLKHRTGGMS
jgi:hypothetical protein